MCDRHKCDVCAALQRTLHRMCVHVRIPNVKEGFAEEKYGNACACVLCVRTCMCVYARRMGVPVEKGVGIVSVKRKKYIYTHTT